MWVDIDSLSLDDPEEGANVSLGAQSADCETHSAILCEAGASLQLRSAQSAWDLEWVDFRHCDCHTNSRNLSSDVVVVDPKDYSYHTCSIHYDVHGGYCDYYGYYQNGLELALESFQTGLVQLYRAEHHHEAAQTAEHLSTAHQVLLVF